MYWIKVPEPELAVFFILIMEARADGTNYYTAVMMKIIHNVTLIFIRSLFR
jgi:hypothetical protein